MTMRTAFAAALAVLIGTAGLAATTAPAAADGFSFGITIGEPHYRPIYRPHPPRVIYQPRPVQVCEKVWRTRKVYNQWGEVVKVVKVRDRECYWTH